jgi:hypothetical protein
LIVGGREIVKRPREINVERYKNIGGDSGVAAYEIGQESITVQFKDGSVYLYNNQSAGNANIAEMQRLAVAGHGLNSFIIRVVRKGYAQKMR